MSIIDRIRKFFFRSNETDPRAGYDTWSLTYDNQPDNLMLALDELVFSQLLGEINLADKTVVDVGCGTGRHWNKLINGHPGRVIGYDVSAGMLEKLKAKFPAAETCLTNDHQLPGLANQSCDVLVSTLSIAHIKDLELTLQEWNRVLKPSGEILLTDYHPAALSKGGKRSFRHEGKTIALKNYIHPLDRIRELAKQLHFHEIRLIERIIDESVKPYYEKQQALPLFEQYRGTPIIYGIHLKKTDDTA